ncbi:DNA-directed RNA polymerase subunit A'' [Halobaculum sp. CBA1158]|uniref:DNA-directed RNA polymerase subunit A'' n=1 Tax=Halobaculum sp. CBA1158 TaxID=2904243 RepID=UPI001F20CF38|nr:DNA-directed RNA polymerase subunit A'' [Halobaculum sp. CBA1158]UIP00602.1 DNA-directed RNA polymerase subunit A'' [Halobaculum sp. CBA1158]
MTDAGSVDRFVDAHESVTEDIALVVEDTELPRRLKNEIYENIDGRGGVTAEQANEIAQAAESRYLDTRVDPLDPVGTVSAQSIGEPGTQMSVPADERVVIRRGGETDVTEIGPLVDRLMESQDVREIDGHEVALAPDELEVPSLREDEQVEWKPVEEVSRHETPDELLRFELESGRTIRATKAHSFVTRRDNEVVPVAGDELDEGDWLPVVADVGASADAPETVDVREHLSAEDYWFTSTLTDGGAAATDGTFPVGDEQVANKRNSLDAGEIEEGYAYPVGGNVGLPEELPLDETTGFFVGAFLAEGNLTDYYVSVSNVDAEFQERVRAFAERFDLSVNEYENTSGFADSYDIRVNGTVLADLLCATCTEGGEKVVPGFAFGAPDEFVRALLRGYFSGDGNVGRNSIRASSVSNRLTAGVALLLSRVGVYATLGETDDSRTLRIPAKHVRRFNERVGIVGERGDELAELAATVDPDGPDATDQIPNFGDALGEVAADAGIPSRQVNAASNRQRIGRNRLAHFVDEATEAGVDSAALADLERAVDCDVVWDRIASIEAVESDHEHVYDFSVEGLETFTTAEGVITHNTMNTFHYAGVAEMDVTQGLPRLIELVDARKTPDTPIMVVHLDDEHATDREKAHEVVWQLEATKILALGDVSTNVADMVVSVDLNEETLLERWPTHDDPTEVAGIVADTIEDSLGVSTRHSGTNIQFGPDEPSYRQLLQLVEQLREIVFKGIEEVTRVVIRKEEVDDGDEEYVLYTEGSAFADALEIEGVDASRTTCNNIHEIYRTLGVEAARETIINETMETLEEQGLDDVNIRHLMLVSDIMTNRGTVESIGRHGISGSKDSVLARAAFEVTVNHLLDAAIHGEADDLNGVIENVIVGKPVSIGTGDVDLRMGSAPDPKSADD